MATYETHPIIEGRGSVTMVLDLDELQALVNSVFSALDAAKFTRAESGIYYRGPNSYRKYVSGFAVFTSKQFAWAQVRNFSKAGHEISAKKYLPALLAAGIDAELKNDGRISLKVELKEKVAA
jgi:hypothetical protein